MLDLKPVLIVACAGVLVAQLDTSVANLAVHKIHAALGGDVTALRWIIDAYNLTYAAAILSAGTLGDLFGRRRVFCLGMLVFIGGSIGCALAPMIAWLIAARAVTGVGAALEVPATLALLSVAFPERAQAARARALGIWASMNGFAFIIGPLLGGVLADTLSWRSLFAVAIPVALAAVVLALGLPESEIAGGHALDIGGQLLAASMLGGFAAAGMAERTTCTRGCSGSSSAARRPRHSLRASAARSRR
jgi:MFS transporter, DHA2 family, methylenomycin A resistance protein